MGLIDTVVGIALGLTVFFLLVDTIILPFFNGAYNRTVTGLSNTTTRGLLLIVLVLGMIAVGLRVMPKTKK